MQTRRSILVAALATTILAGLPATGFAQGAKDVKVALIAPLSGPWARAGQMMRQGAELAIEDINNAGGIKALGGAKMQLIVADAGDSPDKARNAAQRLVADQSDLTAGTGAWLSSFTLAVTEVTERASLPWLTISFSDQVTARGFKFVFQTSPSGTRQAEIMLPTVVQMAAKATGRAPKTIGVLTDNTPSPASFLKPMRETGFKSHNLQLVVDETFTPPLSDATAMVQKVRAARPEILLLFPTGTPDNKLIIEKMNEFGLGKGRVPIVGSGGQLATPELRNLLGKDIVEGLMTVLAGWPTKELADLHSRFKAKYNEPWMTQDPLYAYGDMWLIKEAIEQAKSADREKVGEALRAMDTREGPAKYYSGHRIRFDERGRRIDAGLVIVQWQNGEPVLVYPADLASAAPIWPKQ